MSFEELVERAARLARVEGTSSPIAGLTLLRQNTPSSFVSSLYEPVVCLILEGRKRVSMGDETWSFGPGECLLVSHDVPVRSRITKAPYSSLVYRVDIATIRALHDDVGPALEGDESRVASSQKADVGLVDALARYWALADAPRDARVLGPLVAREIHYRLLMAPYGGMLRQLARKNSHASAIARAIRYIRGELRAPIAVPDLARRVGMSPSSFHDHFKSITSTTPLQYQKELRLIEARRLLQERAASVTTVAYEVGYESSSQFSREYARKFGVPPSRDRTTT